MDLTLDARIEESGTHNGNIGVWFLGSGASSTWTNVEIIGHRAAWYDDPTGSGYPCAPGTVRQKNNFFSSTFRLAEVGYSGAIDVFFSSCADDGIWGSEIIVDVDNGFDSTATPKGVLSRGDENIVRLYGTNIAIVGKSSGPAINLIGLFADCGGDISMSSGEVVVRHDGAGSSNVTGAWAEGNGSNILTPETSFGVKVAGTGTATRVQASDGTICAGGNKGTMAAPFQWPAATNPPMGGNGSHLVSLNGQDSYFEIDCPISALCAKTPASGDKYPHLMIYSNACALTAAEKGPWFDTVTNKCRGI